MSFANKIVYIAGPITGRMDTYKQAFAKAEEYLSSLGAVVLNPATLPIGLKSHQAYMNICLPMLREAEVLALLPGWERSKGAVIEYGEALKLGLTVYDFSPTPANDNAPPCKACRGSGSVKVWRGDYQRNAMCPRCWGERTEPAPHV